MQIQSVLHLFSSPFCTRLKGLIAIVLLGLWMILTGSFAHAFPGLRCQATHPYRIIPSSDLTKSSQTVPNEFGLTAQIQTAYYNGKLVILKYATPEFGYELAYGPQRYAYRKQEVEATIHSEAFWQSWLNHFGIGRKIYGMTTLNGKPALVLEYIPLNSTIIKGNDDGKIADTITRIGKKHLHVTEQTLQELDRVINFLIDHEIYAGDLQFLLTEDGSLVLIDSADFQPPKSRDQLLSLYARLRMNFLAILQPVGSGI